MCQPVTFVPLLTVPAEVTMVKTLIAAVRKLARGGGGPTFSLGSCG